MARLRFVLVVLCVLGLAACAYASARLAGWVPPSKLPPYPWWTLLHFTSAGAFVVIAPLQLWAGLRRRRPQAHRMLGRVGVASGCMMALSGVTMAYASPNRPVTEQIFMTAFFASYLAMLGLGARAAIVRDFAAHRAWMLRMTAVALTPITQRVIFPVFAMTLGVGGLERFWQLFISAAWIAWAINMVAVETWLRVSAQRPQPVAPSSAPAPMRRVHA
jgi:hypothetical protein